MVKFNIEWNKEPWKNTILHTLDNIDSIFYHWLETIQNEWRRNKYINEFVNVARNDILICVCDTKTVTKVLILRCDSIIRLPDTINKSHKYSLCAFGVCVRVVCVCACVIVRIIQCTVIFLNEPQKKNQKQYKSGCIHALALEKLKNAYFSSHKISYNILFGVITIRNNAERGCRNFDEDF